MCTTQRFVKSAGEATFTLAKKVFAKIPSTLTVIILPPFGDETSRNNLNCICKAQVSEFVKLIIFDNVQGDLAPYSHTVGSLLIPLGQ
jgi:hypothetical protein